MSNIKIPCKDCLVFIMCKQMVHDVYKKDQSNRVWLSLYFTCSIFSTFYDLALTSLGSDTMMQQFNDELELIYKLKCKSNKWRSLNESIV